MRARYNDSFLRPGGTVAGPVMMGLADAAMYALVLAHAGPVELAVTTSLNINFLRKPSPGDVLAVARPLNRFWRRRERLSATPVVESTDQRGLLNT